MRPFAHLDYLYLEVPNEGLLKYNMADKSTQCDEVKDEVKEEVIIKEHKISVSAPPSTVKLPPQRPPPPKLTKSFDDTDFQRVSDKTYATENFSKNHRDLKIKKRFTTLKENTTKFTKNVYKKMIKKPVKSQSVGEVMVDQKHSVPDLNHTENHVENKSENELSSPDIEYRCNSSAPYEKSKSLNHRSAPPQIIKSVSSVMSLEDLLTENESIFSQFIILPLINEYSASKSLSSETTEFGKYIDDCLDAFIKTCHCQISDIISGVNDQLSHSLDLDSIGLSCLQPELYTVFCIPGWKQLRVIEDNNTKEKFISLKNSYTQSWVSLNQEKINLGKRWICFPIHSINTLESEVQFSENDVFLKTLLKMLMLNGIKTIYDNEKISKNVDWNSIILVSSKCGIIIVFRECLNESELTSLKFLECDSYESIVEVLPKSKMEVHELITNFFQRPEVISVLISSTWPLDYLALLLAELVMEENN